MASTPLTRVSRDRYNTSPGPDDSSSGTATPMVIPRAYEPVPPPLPPPTLIPEISAGNDPGWQWGNADSAEFGGFATVKPGSSLLGQRSQMQSKEHGQGVYPPIDLYRRYNSVTNLGSVRDQEMQNGSMTHFDKVEKSSFSISSTEYVVKPYITYFY